MDRSSGVLFRATVCPATCQLVRHCRANSLNIPEPLLRGILLIHDNSGRNTPAIRTCLANGSESLCLHGEVGVTATYVVSKLGV